MAIAATVVGARMVVRWSLTHPVVGPKHHPAEERRREVEGDEPREKRVEREAVLNHHPVHRGVHATVGPGCGWLAAVVKRS